MDAVMGGGTCHACTACHVPTRTGIIYIPEGHSRAVLCGHRDENTRMDGAWQGLGLGQSMLRAMQLDMTWTQQPSLVDPAHVGF